LGANSLENNTTGSSNTAVGLISLRDNTTGVNNTAFGRSSLVVNTTGNSNTAFGNNSLLNNTTGSNNTAIGNFAGHVISNGFANQTGSDSIFIGVDTRPLANGQANQIVIGNGAIGHGSNTVTLGNSSIVTTILRGNVGIGTTSPASNLHVKSSSGSAIFRIEDAAGNALGRLQANAGDGNINLFEQNGYALTFGTSNTERMRITSGGDVLIGGTIKIGLTYYDTNGLTIRNAANDSNLWSINKGAGDGTENWNFYNFTRNSIDFSLNNSNGSLKLATLGTGLVYSNGGTLTSTNPSDERLKDDITDLQYGLNEILQLRPVSYNWKNDTINQGKQFGFIAQEVQEVMPELISEFTTIEDDEEVVRLGLDKEGIYATLVNAIKEQNKVLVQLKAEIELLKQK
jgi:hypothetical protein